MFNLWANIPQYRGRNFIEIKTQKGRPGDISCGSVCEGEGEERVWMEDERDEDGGGMKNKRLYSELI